MSSSKEEEFEDIQHDDKLVRFYTGFVSYTMFLAFLSSLGQLLSVSSTGIGRIGRPATGTLQKTGTKE